MQDGRARADAPRGPVPVRGWNALRHVRAAAVDLTSARIEDADKKHLREMALDLEEDVRAVWRQA
jgi:hypothetical protein